MTANEARDPREALIEAVEEELAMYFGHPVPRGAAERVVDRLGIEARPLAVGHWFRVRAAEVMPTYSEPMTTTGAAAEDGWVQASTRRTIEAEPWEWALPDNTEGR